MEFCPKCGCNISVNDKFCAKCGYNLQCADKKDTNSNGDIFIAEGADFVTDSISETKASISDILRKDRLKIALASGAAILAALLMIILINAVITALSLTPKGAVKHTFNSIAASEQLVSMINNDKETAELIGLILEDFDYKIKSVSKDSPTSATAKVEIKSADMKEVAKEAIGSALDAAFTSGRITLPKKDVINALKEKHSTVKNTVDITINKDGLSWKVDITESILNTVTGDLLGSVYKLIK